jgi:hypothetical protein
VTRRVLIAAVAVVGLAAPAAGVFGRATPDVAFVDALLKSQFRFSATQIADVHRGRAVSVSLMGSLDREIVAAGAVRIEASPERLLEVFSDIEKLEIGGGFLKTVKIGDPPRQEDFASLKLPRDDLSDLRHCREGDCELKMSPAALGQAAAIDWRAADADQRGQQFARRMAFDVVEGYRKRGNAAFPTSVDENPPRQVAAEFEEMLARTEWLGATMPALSTYLRRYPEDPRPAGLREYFYWSLVEFGLKTVLRLNHVVLYPLGSGPARWALANRQIYASHYFQNALEMRLLVDDPANPAKAHYLLVLNVARPDGLTGLFGGLVRYKVRNGSRDALRKTLVITKQRCESRPAP